MIVVLVEGGGAHLDAGIDTQTLGDRRVHALGIHLSHDVVGALVDVFPPDCHANHGGSPSVVSGLCCRCLWWTDGM